MDNVRIDCALQARDATGLPAEVYILLKTPFGWFSYTGFGPIAGWQSGIAPCHLGPLIDINVIPLDRPMPVGSYNTFLVLDFFPNARLDHVYDHDSCDFEVKLFAGFAEDFNDGVADGWIDDGPHWSVGNGTYNLDCPSYKDWFSYYDLFSYSDFTYTAEMRMLTTTSFSDTYDRGIYFRTDGTQSNGYEVYMQNDGSIKYVLHRNSSSGTTVFSHLSPNMVIGVDNWNSVSVDARGSNMDVYVNGVLDYNWIDTTFTAGKVGLMGQGSSGYNHEYEFDNVTLTL